GAMKNEVCRALVEFCGQDDEFSQAVVQGGGFADCMNAVAKGVGGSLSDIEAYRRAVTYYFPGAGVHFNMAIDLCASVNEKAADICIGSGKTEGGILISLDAFF
ncbi:MAG: hypothetical protein RR394_09025, partial [Oscillospiraceae bacterium]